MFINCLKTALRNLSENYFFVWPSLENFSKNIFDIFCQNVKYFFKVNSTSQFSWNNFHGKFYSYLVTLCLRYWAIVVKDKTTLFSASPASGISFVYILSLKAALCLAANLADYTEGGGGGAGGDKQGRIV